MRIRLLIALIACALAFPRAASAQLYGPQILWGDDSDFGVGGRGEFDVGSALARSGPFAKAALAGSFDFFFPDCDTGGSANCDLTYWELHGGLLVPIPAAQIKPYAGAGLHFAHASADVAGGGFGGSASDNDVGLDLLGGLRFALSDLSAFAEVRIEAGGGDQFEVVFGTLFGKR